MEIDRRPKVARMRKDISRGLKKGWDVEPKRRKRERR
jgi:hypothetical protein